MIQSAEISCEMFVSEEKGEIYYNENEKDVMIFLHPYSIKSIHHNK